MESRLMQARYKAKRVGRPSPYVDYALRCQYAVETMRSLRATVQEQIIELELEFTEENSDYEPL